MGLGLNMKVKGGEETLATLSELAAKLREVEGLMERINANKPTLETLISSNGE